MNSRSSTRRPIGAFRVGLTGGVGSGKSTVGALLAERGAVVIDADVVAREVVEPGTPGLAAIVERFGAGILDADGTLDRPGLAAIVFHDSGALADLNAIVHPLVRARSDELMADVAPGRICVYEVPLMAEGGPVGRRDFDLVVVVEAPLPVRIARLAGRGLPPEQARARIAAQASDEQRRAIADVVVLNEGSHDDLAARVERLWMRLKQAAGERADPAGGWVSKPPEEIR